MRPSSASSSDAATAIRVLSSSDAARGEREAEADAEERASESFLESFLLLLFFLLSLLGPEDEEDASAAPAHKWGHEGGVRV